MGRNEVTVRAAIFRAMPSLTATERKLGQAILSDYPFNGLQTVTELAGLTGTSAPSITRFVTKLGYAGYPEFQRRLIGELKAGRSSPLDLVREADGLSSNGFLDDYLERVKQTVDEMARSISDELIEEVCALLADPSRRVFILGGRVTDAIARYLSVHLQQVRDEVAHMPTDPEQWPVHVLSMRRQDVLVVFDVRRYQPDLVRLARLAREKRRSRVVLVTDKWLSPVARQATHVFGLPVDVSTAWDTGITLLALVEAIIARVADVDWSAARARIEALDELRPDREAAAEDPATDRAGPASPPDETPSAT